MSIDVQIFKTLFPNIVKHCHDDAGASAFMNAVTEKHVSSGDVVIHEGDDMSDLFFVVSGKLTTSLQGNNETVVMGTVSSGDTFCKASLLDPGPAPMTVTADEDSDLLVLSHDAFRGLEKDYLQMTGNMLRMLSDDLIGLCRKADKVLFERGTSAGGGDLRTWALDTYKSLHGEQEAQS